jgi:hypothetical protein
MRTLVLAILSLAAVPHIGFGQKTPTAASDTAPKRANAYALSTWSNITCRAKGRFQDREYCASPVIDQIVADGKDAIPVLISQITDSRFIAEPVYDYWPRIRTGEFAYFILGDLFTDDTWQKSTMPNLFPAQTCAPSNPAWVRWGNFRKTHSLKDLQTRWTEFWKAKHEKIYWDNKARCFRLRDAAR